MKTYNYFFLIVFICISSCTPEYIKISNRLEGSWQLAGFEYIDAQGKIVSNKKSNYTVTFINDRGSNGVLKTSATEYSFVYDFGYEQFDYGYALCNIDVENARQLPTDVIGKVQVYSYKFINRKTLEFYVDNDYDFINKQILKKAKYTFVKK